MRIRIFIAVAGTAAAALALAHASGFVWLAGLAAAIVVAGLLNSSVDTRLRRAENESEQSTRRLESQITELNTDRARTVAILSAMVEGVLVVDSSGRMRLMNDAARRMLNVDDAVLG